MIAQLRGKLVAELAESVVIDVAGVGYLVRPSTRTRQFLAQRRPEEEVTLVVHTEVRENDISLYGFDSELEKEVFLLLQRVRGVGAKLALQIVSSVGAQSLLSTIGQGSHEGLRKVPGVGKKTAERIIVELREIVSELASEARVDIPSLNTQVEIDSSTGADAMLALERLGFSSEQSQAAVAQAIAKMGEESKTEELLHLALTLAAK